MDWRISPHVLSAAGPTFAPISPLRVWLPSLSGSPLVAQPSACPMITVGPADFCFSVYALVNPWSWAAAKLLQPSFNLPCSLPLLQSPVPLVQPLVQFLVPWLQQPPVPLVAVGVSRWGLSDHHVCYVTALPVCTYSYCRLHCRPPVLEGCCLCQWPSVWTLFHWPCS